MKYARFIPDIRLQSLVDCYWLVEGHDTEVQKVVPDGCPELIFHFGDPYEIGNGKGLAEIQEPCLVAGQLDRPIYLRPTGKSGVLGIKFKPLGLWRMFGTDMHLLTNYAYSLSDVIPSVFENLTQRLRQSSSQKDRISQVEDVLLGYAIKAKPENELDLVIETIQSSKGQITLSGLAHHFNISNRKIERLFHQRVGISAKRYSRLIRFTSVFSLIQKPAMTKAEASYLAGYFDQAHFNRDFHQFTGESPEIYFKHNHSFANFFWMDNVSFFSYTVLLHMSLFTGKNYESSCLYFVPFRSFR